MTNKLFIILRIYVAHAKEYVATRVAVDDIGYYRKAVPPIPKDGFVSTIPDGAESILVLKSETTGLFTLSTPEVIDHLISEIHK